MFPRLALRSAALLLLLAGTSLADDKPIAGLGPTGPIKKLHGDFKFVEGPAHDAHGNVYFSDIPNERVHKIDLDGKLTTVREKTNKANGLMLNAKGEIVACEGGAGAVVAYSADGKDRRVIADKYDGKPFNSPNDLVLDKAGGVYFTDPFFGKADTKLPQDKMGVYYADAAGKVTRLIDDLPKPNGVILSPDEKTLYVVPSGQKQMMTYPVESPGKLGKGKVLCELAQAKQGGNGGGDGLTVDVKGNLYITSGMGLQVFDAVGKPLGAITFPEGPANVTFGGKDMKTLFVTARTSVYTCPMEIAGHRFPAK